MYTIARAQWRQLMVYVTLCMCVCNCMCAWKKVSPSSKGRIFALFFINSLSHPSLLKLKLTSLLSFRVRIPTFWVKNVEFIDIGNIGFLAACGFCILMVCARGARHTKGKSFAVVRGKGFHRLKVIFLSVSMEFWLVPGFKILSKWQANRYVACFFFFHY